MKSVLGSLVIVTSCILCLVPTSAQAADELGLSWDGRSWSGHLNGSLFDPSVRWVPGDVRTNEFYVRNEASDGGNLTISVESRDQDQLLRDDDINLSARIGSEHWVLLERTGKNFRLNSEALGAGDRRKVEVRASFDPASTNQSQRDELALKFRVTLADARAGSSDGDDQDGSDDNSNGLLPDTGAPVVGWSIVVGGVAVGVGLALMKRRRGEGENQDG
ncbi:hypothetical protein ASG90_17335 [Nocardioides sp. Soil797]|nr:hypothetical protein ASG90_17335 [Nocardioides sp. Soil797]